MEQGDPVGQDRADGRLICAGSIVYACQYADADLGAPPEMTLLLPDRPTGAGHTRDTLSLPFALATPLLGTLSYWSG